MTGKYPGERSKMRKLITLAVLAGLVTAGLALVAGTASATPQGKVSICHRTASDKNPYVLITVNQNAVDAHVGEGAHPAKNGREDYFASGSEIEQGFCGEVGPGTARYRIIRRMTLLKTYFDGAAGLGVSVTCDGTDYTVTLGEDEVTVPVGESRRGSILRVRSGGVVLVKVRESEVC